MRLAFLIAALVLASAAVPARAGPPYLTDDPDPTDLGHWEIYAFTTGEHSNASADPIWMPTRGSTSIMAP